MNQKIVQSPTGITIIGAGKVNAAQIETALRYAPLLVAADGGAGSALSNGHIPGAVIGDMDSAPAGLAARLPSASIHPIPEQDSTDFEKCLYSIAAPLVIAVGVNGGRLDHELAALNALVRYPDLAVILLGAQDICFLCPAQLKLTLPIGTRLSLFPMAPATGRSQGLKWPIKGLEFAPSGRIGTSNETTSRQVELQFDRRAVLVLLPTSCLEAVVLALK